MKYIHFFILIMVYHFSMCQNQSDTSFKPSGRPIIQVFSNFEYNAGKNVDKKNGFWFGRAHFGYEQQFSRDVSAKIVIDAGRPTIVGTIEVKDSSGNTMIVTNNSKEGSYYTMTLKFANIEWKPSDFFKLQAGGILQNHYMTQERFWGYRYLAETFQDRYYKMPSGDLGFISYFTVNQMVGFDVAITNGEGFRFDQDPYGNVKFATGFDFKPFHDLQTRFYYDYSHSDQTDKPADQQLFSFFAGYSLKNRFRIGGEYNFRKNHLNLTNNNLYGYSIYSSFLVFDKTEYFIRFDQLLSNTKPGQNTSWNFDNDGKAFITGIHYNPYKGINMAFNYQGFYFEKAGKEAVHRCLLSFEYKL